ncbi:MAG TPA: xanthine dehydrogenase family protein molybdopterin-binding subunit [Gemmatimonadales bacterium]|nr:xanthine dehydrogenase family protein molybdopterin-binding subunit [Gemmatimonadales bacterium]
MTTRRDFLGVTAATGLGLVLGFHRPLKGQAALIAKAMGTDTASDAELNAWVHIAPDDTITLVINESEMGQGVLTSLPMILAEELDADWTKVRSEPAPADTRFGRQSTGGSTSVRMDYANLRTVGAAARAMLIGAAAQRWGVPAGECSTDVGYVVHAASKRRASYGSLAVDAAKITPPEKPPLKDPKDFRIIGKPMKRLDTPDKVRATTEFGIDVRRPGMLIAQVERCPIFGGKLGSFDATKAKTVPGVRHVIAIPSGVAVVADDFWAATKGREALSVTWDDAGHGTLSSTDIAAELRRIVDGGAVARKDGEPDAALAGSHATIHAEYEVPYLAHATMEPMNCTADVRSGSCEIWAPTQAPTGCRDLAAKITGLSSEKVTVHTTYLGGGFGRRSQTDFLEDAVRISKAVGAPVKLVYTREDDMRAGWYRPTAYNKIAGGVDAQGWPTVWTQKIATPSIAENFGPLRDGIDGMAVEGVSNLPYAIPNMLVTYAKPDFPISVWFWRSVGSSQNGYVTECFLDELAHLGGKDPVELRRRLLKDHPRHRRVLDLAAEKAGWGTPLPEGHARGVAVHEAFGSIVAEVAEVSLPASGTPRVHHVVCAVDCGQYVNPDTIKAQMESGIVYGLSAALYGEITIDKGRAVQGNFDSYPIVRLREMPSIDTYIVAEGDPMGGIGEPGTPPIAAAVCNALLALTGKPVRRLPIVRRT